MKSLGDYATSTVIYTKFTTFRPSTGAAFTLGGTPAISVYKDNSTTQSTTGVTLTADFDSVTGLNHVAIDTSADGTFYSAGSNFDIVITTGTVDSVSVVGTVVASFSLAKTAALRPTTAGRTLDVSAGGEAGLDWANIGSPSTAQNLSATNIDTDQVVASVTGAVGSVAGNVGGNVSGSVGSVTAAVTITAASVQAIWDALTSALTTVGSIGKLLVDNINTTISSRLSTAGYTAPLDAAGTRAAVGLASANLDTQLSAIDTVVDLILVDTAEIGAAGAGLTNIGTIATVTNLTNLPSIPANWLTAAGMAADVTTEIWAGSTAPTVGEIADAVWDEALAGHVGAGSTGEALNAAGAAGDPWTTVLPGAYGAGSAGEIIGDLKDGGRLDLLIDAIKAKTDSLNFTVPGELDVNIQSVNDITIVGDGSGTPFNV